MGKTTATVSSKTANKPVSTAKKVKVGKTKIGTSTKSKKVGVEKK